MKLHAFLIFVLDGSQWSTSRFHGCTLEKISAGTRWIQFWTIPIGSMEVVAKIKILLVQRIDLTRPSCSQTFTGTAKKDLNIFNYCHSETSKFLTSLTFQLFCVSNCSLCMNCFILSRRCHIDADRFASPFPV